MRVKEIKNKKATEHCPNLFKQTFSSINMSEEKEKPKEKRETTAKSKKTIKHKAKQKTDLEYAEEKLEKIKAHYEKNKQDKHAMREKDRIFAQVRKMKIYLKKKEK